MVSMTRDKAELANVLAPGSSSCFDARRHPMTEEIVSAGVPQHHHLLRLFKTASRYLPVMHPREHQSQTKRPYSSVEHLVYLAEVLTNMVYSPV